LWEFHKVHHSVFQMRFATHLLFHWMETVICKSIRYIPLALLGFCIQDFFIIHIIAVAIGHLNHANYIPNANSNEPLGFDGIENFPDTFLKQKMYPFKK
jgi:sterol desaturase/sphingolipid hydroxylase (fatty acid hydroxylase superfamily)